MVKIAIEKFFGQGTLVRRDQPGDSSEGRPGWLPLLVLGLFACERVIVEGIPRVWGYILWICDRICGNWG